MQYFFSKEASTCSADTSVSFEKGVAIGSILAYLTMAFRPNQRFRRLGTSTRTWAEFLLKFHESMELW